MRNEDIDKRLNKIEERQTEFRENVDSVLVNQGAAIKEIREIHYLLAGTKYEKDNGGLVGEVSKIKKKVGKNTMWRIRITAAATAIVGLLGFILVRLGSIINTVKGIGTPD